MKTGCVVYIPCGQAGVIQGIKPCLQALICIQNIASQSGSVKVQLYSINKSPRLESPTCTEGW